MTLFIISLVPIQLKCTISEENKEPIVCQNPAPSSSRFGNPVKFVFKQETNELVEKEMASISQEIENLSLTNNGGWKNLQLFNRNIFNSKLLHM